MGFREDFLGIATQGETEINLVHRTTADILEQASALPFWSQDYTQLSKGAFAGNVTSVARQGVQIFREKMNRAVDQIASAPPDTYVIGLPTHLQGESSWGLLPVKPNSLITLDKNAELNFRTSQVSEITVAVISAQRLEEYAAKVEWIDLRKVMEKIKPVESLTPEVSQRLLISLADGIMYVSELSATVNVQKMWRHFEDDLFAACLHALLHASENSGSAHEHRIHRYIVNRVRDLTLASSDCPLTIGELCSSLCISRRTLNHAFSRVLGITPVEYMRNVRLHRIRGELQRSPHQVSSIANVATKWGFWHLSLFSRYYRELFGECPHDTLNYARQR